MEEELRCFTCKQLYVNPVLLPCTHSICLACALDVQQPINSSAVSAAPVGIKQQTSLNHSSLNLQQTQQKSANNSSSSSSSSSVSSDQDQLDKVSILSEADSGVTSCNSRPTSYNGSPNLMLFPNNGATYSLKCPICRKSVIFFDESGARNLPVYRAMESIVNRFCEREALRCQMCESGIPRVASVYCEQCEIRYCDNCRELCHPPRGPLAKHSLVKPRGAIKLRESICADHNESLMFHCVECKLSTCNLCNIERHGAHDVQPISSICKAQKTELSKNLQSLSEKARSTTEFVQRLKIMNDKVVESSNEYESVVNSQFDSLIQMLQERRELLLDSLQLNKETKVKKLKEQQLYCTSKLQQTTGLIHFCIEALKETDNAAFLQVGAMLTNRVVNTDLTWHQDITNAAPRVSSANDLMLDDGQVVAAIENLNFVQLKHANDGEIMHSAPAAPLIIPNKCSAENNSVTVAWQQVNSTFIQGYVLELDDGNGGEFREVYCGKETICTVDGLHFNSLYNSRVKAFNSNGEGEYSEIIVLQTSEVAWFTFDPKISALLNFTNSNHTVNADGWDYSVALGSVGFSRGVHYWEFTIDRYTADTDPAFGIARIDVARDKMLGKDDKGYAMYIDGQRSWFQHNSVHERRVEGGITSGSTIGVLLDLEHHTLSFFVNCLPQGSLAFRDLYGVFYPAVSLNRDVQVTLHTGLVAPHLDCH